LREELCGRRRRVNSSGYFFFHVAGESCMDADAQLLLVAATSDIGEKAVLELLFSLVGLLQQLLWMLRAGPRLHVLLTFA
jgi:hypothetical protein